ncbi:hypothetical protein RB653_007016 [Dictyostelium firmibasis]|uniref:WW domain-containing protein n=1 Tax=Dictyostelium firmibasis TaxID=79012 RepID=A0AAN7TL49_9MYCE
MHYSIKIHNIKAYDLSLKKENHNANNINIDPYVKLKFDQFKKFKTESISKSITPTWKFEQTFHIPIMKDQELKNKKVEIDCYDSCVIGGDNLIGGCSIDFFTVLNGPVHHKLVLRNKGIANGTIEFDLEMSEFLDTKLTFRNLKTSYYAGSLPISSIDQSIEKYLFYYILNSSKLQKVTKTLKTKKSNNLVWEDIDQIIYTIGLKELLICPIVFNILQYKNYNGETDPSLGQVTITLSSIVFDPKQITGPSYGGVDQKMVSFVEPIIHQNQVVGIMEGEIYFDNVSQFIQLQDCVHTETGIQSFAGTNHPIKEQPQPIFINNTTTTTNTNTVSQSPPKSFTQQPFVPQQSQQPFVPQQSQPQSFVPQQSQPQSFVPQQSQPSVPQQQSPPQSFVPQQSQPSVPQQQQQQQQPPEPFVPQQPEPFVPQQQSQPFAPPQSQPQQPQKYQGPEWTDPRLPSGWVIRQDQTGKQFYVDHNTKSAHWTLPTHIAVLLNQPTTATKPLQPVQQVQQQGYVYPQQIQQPTVAGYPAAVQYGYPQQQQQGYVYPQYYQQYPTSTYMMSYPSSSCHSRHHHC